MSGAIHILCMSSREETNTPISHCPKKQSRFGIHESLSSLICEQDNSIIGAGHIAGLNSIGSKSEYWGVLFGSVRLYAKQGAIV